MVFVRGENLGMQQGRDFHEERPASEHFSVQKGAPALKDGNLEVIKESRPTLSSLKEERFIQDDGGN